MTMSVSSVVNVTEFRTFLHFCLVMSLMEFEILPLLKANIVNEVFVMSNIFDIFHTYFGVLVRVLCTQPRVFSNASRTVR